MKKQDIQLMSDDEVVDDRPVEQRLRPAFSEEYRRRSILAAVGAGVGSALTAGVIPKSAHAQGMPPAIPKRIIFFYSLVGSQGAAGSIKTEWEPRAPAGMMAPTENAWELGPLLQPLQAHKSKLVILDGLDMRSQYPGVDPIAANNAHTAGGTHALVADNRATSGSPGNISIDQYIARGINTPGSLTYLPSLEVHCGGTRPLSDTADALAYGSRRKVPVLWDPRLVYDRLFSSGQSASQRDSILNLIMQRYGRLSPRVGAEDRQRFEQHRTMLADLEARFHLANGGAMRPSPTILNGFTDATLRSQEQMYDRTWDLNTQMVVAALALGLTRVVTVESGSYPSSRLMYTPGQFNTQDLHGLTHLVATIPEETVDPMKIAARAITRELHLQEARRFAMFLDRLNAVSFGAQGTLLDHCVVLWCGQIAYGNHEIYRLPWLLAGGLGGAIRTGASGRYLKLPRENNPRNYPERTMGLPHNNLFVSLANRMGVNTMTFGNPRVCTGELAGL